MFTCYFRAIISKCFLTSGEHRTCTEHIRGAFPQKVKLFWVLTSIAVLSDTVRVVRRLFVFSGIVC